MDSPHKLSQFGTSPILVAITIAKFGPNQTAPEETATYLGLSRNALGRLERLSKAPEHVRIRERLIRYRPEAILEFLESRTIAPAEVA
jgi:predicted DNA-binding transcriptional regulator AlpA